MNVNEIVKSLNSAIAVLRVELAQMTSARDSLAALRPSSMPPPMVEHRTRLAVAAAQNGNGHKPSPLKGKPKSEEAIANMKKAQAARFARQRKEAKQAGRLAVKKPLTVKKSKRNLTEAGRKAISDAVKRRHAADAAAKAAA